MRKDKESDCELYAENLSQTRYLEKSLSVIMFRHPNAAGHQEKLMASNPFKMRGT